MGKLANIARNVLGAGGEYISLNDIIQKYPDGVTVNGAFIREYKDKETEKVTQTPCFTFAEETGKYFYAVSGDIGRLFDNLFNDHDKNIYELAENLRYENLKIKIAKVKTKSGKTYVKAWLIDTIEKPRFEVDDDTGEQINTETGEIISDIAPF